MVNVSLRKEEVFWLRVALEKFQHAPHYASDHFQKIFKVIIAKLAKAEK